MSETLRVGDTATDGENVLRIMSLRHVAGGVAADVCRVSGPSLLSAWTMNVDNLRKIDPAATPEPAPGKESV